MKNVIPGIGFVLFVLVAVFSIYCIQENAKREIELRERINTSVVLSCTSALARGPRGEAYKAMVYTLLDRDGLEWLYTPRYLQYERFTCPTVKGD